MLHHRYIVRYYQAWIEGEENSDAASAGSSGKSPPAPKHKSKPPKPPGLARRKSTKSNYELAGGDDDEDWLASSHPSTRVANDDEDDDESDEDEDDEEEDDSKTAAPVAAGRQYLYIQMEYCANQTLRDVIDSKTASMEDCWRLFRQLLEAVAYIHKRGILHRSDTAQRSFRHFLPSGDRSLSPSRRAHLRVQAELTERDAHELLFSFSLSAGT